MIELPERALWQAVLLRAIKDAILDDENNVSEKDCTAARDFLLRDGLDFPTVAQYAGYDPAWLREKLKELL